MARANKGSELKMSGTTLGTRFSIQMSIALAIVMLGAGAYLYNQVVQKAGEIQENAFVEAVEIQGPLQQRVLDDQLRELTNLPANPTPAESAVQVQNAEVKAFADGRITRKQVMYGPKHDKPGFLYQFDKVMPPLIVSTATKERAGQGLLQLILTVTVCVILVGACVAYLVARSVSRPLEKIVDDIGQIAAGNLRHRTRVRAGGEIMVLARSIDRMAGSLEEAQDAQIELGKRERELALADEVREALLPEAAPPVPGYDLGDLHVASPSPGGDFHDFIELPGGRVGLLVCEVSGRGIPGALVGAIARSFLRVELAQGQDVAAALSRANREIARDVKRGMYVTALYVVLDPFKAQATVACAGHKLPLVRFTAADGKVRLVHPEGIALGFDPGPVFDRALQVQHVPLEPGDRILMANTGPVRVKNPEGEELGEKAFYRLLLQQGSASTEAVLGQLKGALESYAGGEPFPADLSIVSVSRTRTK
jgi:serine phosphatase RsbU (regulator of sigma subunit)